MFYHFPKKCNSPSHIAIGVNPYPDISNSKSISVTTSAKVSSSHSHRAKGTVFVYTAQWWSPQRFMLSYPGFTLSIYGQRKTYEAAFNEFIDPETQWPTRKLLYHVSSSIHVIWYFSSLCVCDGWSVEFHLTLLLGVAFWLEGAGWMWQRRCPCEHLEKVVKRAAEFEVPCRSAVCASKFEMHNHCSWY